jgi:carbon-monoxide dehydrogenase large subunit
MLYMRMVRSPVAFGRVTGLRIAEALAHPGTVAAWTAQDIADIPPIGPVAQLGSSGARGG